MRDDAPQAAAVVLAGGSGTRVGLEGGRNKVYLPLEGIPLLAWSLRTLDAAAAVTRLVVVIREGDEDDAAAAIRAAAPRTPVTVVPGGASRSASEARGLEALRAEIAAGTVDAVLLHDAARPFLTVELVRRLLAAVRRCGAAVPGHPPGAGLVHVAPDGRLSPVDVGRLRQVQTPQAFDAVELVAAFDEAARRGIDGADTAELVASCSGLVAEVVDGDPDNIKVTTPADIGRARRIASSRIG